jgi:hypothetical protein
VVVEPPPQKKTEPEVAKVDPVPEKTETPPKKDDTPAQPAEKRDRIEVKGQVWKIIRDGEKYYVQLTKKDKLQRGDDVRVLGPELEKKEREVYGVASVVETEGSLARLLIDEDTVVPPKAFAIKETVPKSERVAKKQKKKEDEAKAKGSEPAKTEVAKAEPAKTEPAKTEPAKTEPANTQPANTNTQPANTQVANTEPAKTEPAKTQEPARQDQAPTARGKVLTGGIVVGRGGKVHIFNRNDFSWHGCEVNLPTKKRFRYEGQQEIAAGDSDGIPLGRFEDFTKPDDPQYANGWALVRCKEGAGYVSFKAN